MDQPKEPYVFKSGKNQGKSVSQLAINDFPRLKYMFGKMEETGSSKKNRLHIQIEWIMEKINKTKPKILCPVCKKKPVRLISVLGNEKYGYSISPKFTCCENKKCRGILKDMTLDGNNFFISANFSSVNVFRNKTDQKRMINLLKKIYGLEGRLTKEKAFNFFKEE